MKTPQLLYVTACALLSTFAGAQSAIDEAERKCADLSGTDHIVCLSTAMSASQAANPARSAPTLGPIKSFRLLADQQSPRQGVARQITFEVEHDSDAWSGRAIGVHVLRDGKQLSSFGYRPGTIAPGSRVTTVVMKQYSDAPLQFHSNAIEFEVFPLSPPVKKDFPFEQTWNGNGNGLDLPEALVRTTLVQCNKQTEYREARGDVDQSVDFTTVRLNAKRRVESQALARASGRLCLVPT